MSFNSIIGAALQTLGQQIVAQMKVNLFKQNVKPGNLSNSIQSEPKQGPNGPYIDITMASYGPILDAGRGKSIKGGPRQTWASKIDTWMTINSIAPRPGVTRKQAIFLITRKINRVGYRAKPFIQPAITEVIQKNLDITMNQAINQALIESKINTVNIKIT